MLGCHLGFTELLRSGAIYHRPRLLVVQPRNCSPLVAALAQGASTASVQPWSPTIAEGLRSRDRYATARSSKPSAPRAVTWRDAAEPGIAPAAVELARSGLYAEPTSAIVVPALR